LEEEQELCIGKTPFHAGVSSSLSHCLYTIKALPSPEASKDDLKQNILLIFLRIRLE
jgi:hypothetical protein